MLLFVVASFAVATTLKVKSSIMTDPPTVSINYDACTACGICVELDPLGYIESIDENGVGFFGIKNSVYILYNSYELLLYRSLADECPVEAFCF